MLSTCCRSLAATSPLQSLIHCSNLNFALRPLRSSPCSSVAPAAAAAASAPAPAATAAAAASTRLRDYPEEPRVGVGVVVLRHLDAAAGGQPEVLLIRRAKEPAKGLWCFPGGSLELGETLVQCAVRETREETGLALRCRAVSRAEEEAGGRAELYSDCLDWPSPIAAADSLTRDASGQRLLYHYAIVNLAAVPEDPRQQPVPADDVDAAQWFPVAQLRGLKDLLVRHCDQISERAVRLYTIRH